MTIRTRIAPSPTGTDIHIGNLYTALINWVVARQVSKSRSVAGTDGETRPETSQQAGGQFIIRIEDTDRTRYIEGAEEKILASLSSYGLKPDEAPRPTEQVAGGNSQLEQSKVKSTVLGVELEADPGEGPYAPYRQSERLPLYKAKAYELVEKGKAYFSFVSKEQLEEFRAQAKLAGKEAKANGEDFSIAERDALKSMLRAPEVAAFTIEEAEKRIATGVTSARSMETSLGTSKEKPSDIGSGVEYTVRLLVPENKHISFSDLIRGEIVFNTNQVDDQVLLKSDGYPTYHLAVVVDDVAMEISHVIRAEEWINSTPKHILLYQAFDWELPVFAHLPILRNPDKSKLSKRKNPVWASWYLEQGYLAEAVLNYLALMGWSHPEEKEIFDIDEFLKVFKLEDVAPVGPVFDIQKLTWMNGMYIRAMKPEKLVEQLQTFYGETAYSQDFLEKTVPLVQERIKLLSEYAGYVDFLLNRPTKPEIDLSEYREALAEVTKRLKGIEDWQADAIGDAMLKCAADLGMKNSKFFQMLRVTVSGKKVSPPLNESMEILGKNECVERVQKST
ncbi:MAG: glutamate--tRNA ligase [Patescibacteria group bacterium]